MCNKYRLKESLVQTFTEFPLNKHKALDLRQTIMHVRGAKNILNVFFFL